MRMSSHKKLPGKGNNHYVDIAIDLILKVGALVLVVFLCFQILKPFLSTLLWGLIIAIILFPVFRRLRTWTRERNKLSSVIIMLVALLLIVAAFILAWDGVQAILRYRAQAATAEAGGGE